MFYLQRPSNEQIEGFLEQCRSSDLSYAEVGATADGPAPTGYNVDHHRVLLGKGESSFGKAKVALRSWTMFDLPWVTLHSRGTPIEPGREVAVVVRHFGFYSLNAARVVYVMDGNEFRTGFAYGTLNQQHAEIGEERFSVEFDTKSGEVWYDLYAFSRPGAFLARAGYPLGRYLQKSFAIESCKAMQAAVSA